MVLAEVTNEGGESMLDTFIVAAEPWFSWELEGSRASLLGTGVIVEGFLLALDLVVSFRQGEEGKEFWDGDALAKKPRMLCCFPVAEDEMEL